MAESKRLAPQRLAGVGAAVRAPKRGTEIDQRVDLLEPRRARVGQRDRLGQQLESAVAALGEAQHAQIPDHDPADARCPREVQLFDRSSCALDRSPNASCASAAVERQATAPGHVIP